MREIFLGFLAVMLVCLVLGTLVLLFNAYRKGLKEKNDKLDKARREDQKMFADMYKEIATKPIAVKEDGSLRVNIALDSNAKMPAKKRAVAKRVSGDPTAQLVSAMANTLMNTTTETITDEELVNFFFRENKE